MRIIQKTLLFLSLWLSVSLLACSPGVRAKQPVSLALLPILDNLPVHVALQEGFFKDAGVEVEIIQVGSGPERDQLIAAEQADGMINELVSTLFFNKESSTVLTVRYARVAAPGAPLFSLLAGPQSGVQSVQDLKGAKIGISDGTIIAYVTERILEDQQIPLDAVSFISVPKLDARLALLTSGNAEAAVLPEPMATLAEAQGAVRVVDDADFGEYSFSAYTFRRDFAEKHPESLRAFLSALEKAVERINQDPQQYNALMIEKKMMPEALQGKFQVPQFALAGVPSEAQFADSLAWAQQKGYLIQTPAYEDCVSGAYLP